MATTTNMLLDLPEVGTTSVNAAASKLVTALETLDAHDHSSGSGTKVTTAGININADLELNSKSLTEVYSVSMDNLGSSLSGASNSNRLNVANGELFFTDGNGLPVQITANGGVDITVSGGWTGDYSSTDAEATYVSATSVFKLLQNGNTNQAGKLDVGDIKLRTTVAGASNFVTIVSPTLSANWTMTLPAAAPASTSVMTMTSAGVVATSKELELTSAVATGAVTAATVSGTNVDGETLEIWGDSTLTTATFSGLLTANGGVTLGSGDSITLQGTGELKHDARTITIPANAGNWEGISGSFTSGVAEADAGTDTLYIPITLLEGDTITFIQYRLTNLTSASKTASLKSINFSTGVTTTHETSTFTTSGATIGSFTCDPVVEISNQDIYYFQFDAGAAGDKVVGIRVMYEHP